MSQSPSPSSSSKPSTQTASSSNFKLIFEKALKEYKKKTRQDLTAHPLASQLQKCESPAAVLAILQDQVDQFNQSRCSDERLQRWLNPTINVLQAFSETIGEGISFVNMNGSVSDLALITLWQAFSPAKVIFVGAGVLLQVGNLGFSLVRALVTSEVLRRPRTSKQAKTSLSISSSASKTSSDDSRFIPRCHQLRR